MSPILPDIPTQVATKHLLLRCYRPGDGATYFHVLRANRDHLYEFLPPHLMTVQNEEDAENVIRKLNADWQLRTLFIFGVWEKGTGTYVGEIYLANADWQVPCIELGYFVVKESTGKGIATEAVQAMIHFAFDHLQVSRIELQCAADNAASIRVAERCGFHYEGRLRQRNRKQDGDLVDRLWYGLLSSEWQNSVA
ncbi:MAG: GNAT family N-acetyltransferase, partial [Aliifodinibius sp.]|nr:GNAT family N-acetyltransferase [Fodinibius sp.]NIV11149.1 GNAT family N-acetyltransferase [Fodinibius sp.]NIY24739.1 GNAT family N-acetyltransferase [Fodinibius sp.]